MCVQCLTDGNTTQSGHEPPRGASQTGKEASIGLNRLEKEKQRKERQRQRKIAEGMQSLTKALADLDSSGPRWVGF